MRDGRVKVGSRGGWRLRNESNTLHHARFGDFDIVPNVESDLQRSNLWRFKCLPITEKLSADSLRCPQKGCVKAMSDDDNKKVEDDIELILLVCAWIILIFGVVLLHLYGRS